MRRQAVVIACPGPGGGDFRVLRRPPRTRRARLSRGATFYFNPNAKEAPRHPVITL